MDKWTYAYKCHLICYIVRCVRAHDCLEACSPSLPACICILFIYVIYISVWLTSACEYMHTNIGTQGQKGQSGYAKICIHLGQHMYVCWEGVQRMYGIYLYIGPHLCEPIYEYGNTYTYKLRQAWQKQTCIQTYVCACSHTWVYVRIHIRRYTYICDYNHTHRDMCAQDYVYFTHKKVLDKQVYSECRVSYRSLDT